MEARPGRLSPGRVSGWLAPAFARMSLSTPETNGFRSCRGAPKAVQKPSLSLSASREQSLLKCTNTESSLTEGEPFFRLPDSVCSVSGDVDDISICRPCHPRFTELWGGERGTSQRPRVFGPLTILGWDITPCRMLGHRETEVPAVCLPSSLLWPRNPHW